MKLTADTITDDQIRELRRVAALEDPDDDATPTYCNTALMAPLGSLRRATARGYCADILNDRAATKRDDEIFRNPSNAATPSVSSMSSNTLPSREWMPQENIGRTTSSGIGYDLMKPA